MDQRALSSPFAHADRWEVDLAYDPCDRMDSRFRPTVSVAEEDPSGLDRWVRDYGRLVRSVVRRVSGTRLRGSEEDVEQRVYLALWKRLRSAPQPEQAIAAPSSYVFRAAVRETVRMLREECDPEPPAALAASAANGEVADSGSRSREEVLHLRRQLEDVLSTLPTDRRRAVEAHLSGFEVKELMELWDWPYQKARNLVARGMADLRRGLKARGIEP
jgi:RNA polymerase sigma factor (sigma-70 family)